MPGTDAVEMVRNIGFVSDHLWFLLLAVYPRSGYVVQKIRCSLMTISQNDFPTNQDSPAPKKPARQFLI